MWPFTKKQTYLKSGVFKGFTDWHCHILPGVDDGVKTMEESLKILHRYESLGITDVWLTPHVMEDVPNTVVKLRNRYEELCDAYKKDGGTINLNISSEHMIDNLFLERLPKHEFLPLGDSHHLLVETSYFSAPERFYDILEEIKKEGYFPVLAHPERYIYMTNKDYVRLKSMDIMFQMNLFSLTGQYGPEPQKKAEWLLKKGFIDLLGTDLHRHRVLEVMLEPKVKAEIIKRFPENRIG